MSDNQTTRDAGLRHVFSILSGKGWNYTVIKQGRAELHRIEKNGIKHVIKIRTLSKEDPIPFPKGLGIFDSIDYLVICNNLNEQPNLIILKPQTVREIIHKDSKNELAYWLETNDYQKHGMTFEQAFG